MKVELLDHMGTDLTVVNSARVSFAKTSTEFGPKDVKLIQYLAAHNHWTVFGHCFASFRIAAPIFVARQLVKHSVGLVWNEVSYRYVEPEPEFHMPDFRLAAASAKQGSSSESLEDGARIHAKWEFDEAYNTAYEAYQYALSKGVAKEVARAVLPLSTQTEWIWSGSLAAWARVCKLRLDPHTQKETQVIAEGISEACQKLWPVSWNALMADPNKAKLDRIKGKLLALVEEYSPRGYADAKDIHMIFEQS